MSNKTKKQKSSWELELPDITLDVDKDNLDLFFYTLFERQEIWYKRFLKQQPPYTEDEILIDYKFTNVYRELDRSSQFLIKNVLLNKDNDIYDIVFQIFVFRIYNKPETFKELPLPKYNDFNIDDFIEYLSILEESGFKTLNDSAYKINTYIWQGVPRWKAYAINLVNEFHKLVPKIVESFSKGLDVKEFVDSLKIYGVGGFLSHEFFQDLTYIKRYTTFSIFPYTQDDFTHAGPGAVVGLRLTLPSKTSKKKQIEGIEYLRDISKTELAKIGEFKYLNWDKKTQKYFVTAGEGDLTLHQIEMWLCEYQKYWKMLIGQGKQRGKIELSNSKKDYSFYLY